MGRYYNFTFFDKFYSDPDYSGIEGWGDKGYKYALVEKVNGSFPNRPQGEAHAWARSNVWACGNGVSHPAKTEEQYSQQGSRILNEPSFLPAVNYKDNSILGVPRWVNEGDIIKPVIEAGYEFWGWRYYYNLDGGYWGYDSDGKESSLVLSPDSTFGGLVSGIFIRDNCIEVINAKAGIIKVNFAVNESYNDDSNLNQDYKISILIPIVKYIKRTVSFNVVGGNELEDVFVEGTDLNVSLPLPTRKGYLFKGWYSDDSYTNKIGDAGDQYEVPENITLYAKWETAIPTVFWDANGGTITITSSTVELGATYGNMPVPFRNNYKFDGWYTASDGGELVKSNTIVTNPEDHTLYAHWVGAKFRIVKKDFANQEGSSPQVGKLKLSNSGDNYTSEIVDTDGVIEYDGPALTFKLSCEIGEEGNEFLWKNKGVYSDGEYRTNFQFSFEAGTENEIVYFIQKKTVYQIQFDSKKGTAEVTSPAVPDGDGYIEGRNLEITVTPDNGYRLVSANAIDTNSGDAIGTWDNIENNKFVVSSIGNNLKIYLQYVREEYRIDVSVDGPSAIAVKETTYETSAYYDDEKTFSVELNEGYELEGWFAEDGTKVSSDLSFTHKVTGNVSFIIKAKVSIQVGIKYDDNRTETSQPITESCKLYINDSAVGSPHSFYVVLGQSFSYRIELGGLGEGIDEKWKFKAWENSEGVVLAYPQSGSISPTKAMELQAHVISAIITYTVSIAFKNDDVEPIQDVEVDNPDIVVFTPNAKSKSIVDGKIIATFEGSQMVSLDFAEAITIDGSELTFSRANVHETEFQDDVFSINVNDDINIVAQYGTTGNRTLVIDYANGSDWSMGNILIDDKSSAVDPVPISISKEKNSTVLLKATSKNGYNFVGWYDNQRAYGSPIHKESELQFTIRTNRTLYAKYVKNLSAIFEWEGDADNKMMEWRSKTYAASKPFNPSACRVDTTGYPVASLSVEMFSAPDKKPTTVAELKNVKSQDSRRLPIRRMERYMQVSIKNNQEVDAVLVGTSMGGLAV
jgi:uncharacterized repeat protein (TIGR02543 family)